MASPSSNFTINKIQFFDVKGKKVPNFPPIIGFDYEEDLFSPFTYGSMIVNDSKENLLADLPIQGGERIIISITGPDDENYDYEFIVYGIKNRFSTERVQGYELKLIDAAALKNENSRPCGTFSGKQSRIVLRLLKDWLEIDTTKVFLETTRNETKFQTDGSTDVYKLINKLSLESISDTFVPASSGKSESGEIKPLKGTAGFLFYQNLEGYHFKSVDSLCNAEENKPVRIFKYYAANQDYESRDDVIYDYAFDSEVNLIENLRKGSYSSVLCFYNYSTGKYEEYQYSMEDTFSTMTKLGSQTSLGETQKNLSKKPTKVMSVVTDHETWWSGEGPGSFEPADGGNGENPFGDYSKQFIAQSLGRIGILGTQKLRIAVTGSPSIMVGDRVEIFLPNVKPSGERKSQSWDDENSGVYLVSHIINKYDQGKGEMHTQLSLVRDSSGRLDRSSNVK